MDFERKELNHLPTHLQLLIEALNLIALGERYNSFVLLETLLLKLDQGIDVGGIQLGVTESQRVTIRNRKENVVSVRV